jgi:hypothetical protein
MTLDQAWTSINGAYLTGPPEMRVGHLLTKNRFHETMKINVLSGQGPGKFTTINILVSIQREDNLFTPPPTSRDE